MRPYCGMYDPPLTCFYLLLIPIPLRALDAQDEFVQLKTAQILTVLLRRVFIILPVIINLTGLGQQLRTRST